MAKKGLLDDSFFTVWAEGALGQEFFLNGYNPKGDNTIAFTSQGNNPEKLVKEMQMMHPGKTVYLSRSTQKHAVQIVPLPVLNINDKGEVIL